MRVSPRGYSDDALPIKERYDALMALFEEHPDTTFVLGPKTRHAGDRYSSVVAYEQGRVSDVYDKRAPLPLAEQSSSYHEQTYEEPIMPGAAEQSFTIRGTPASVLICSEIHFSELVSANSGLIISVSNEDTFTSSVFSYQNHILAKLRAAENRQYVLRAAKDGISAIIEPTGRVQSRSVFGDSEVLFGELRN